jgi:hypothetical protein
LASDMRTLQKYDYVKRRSLAYTDQKFSDLNDAARAQSRNTCLTFAKSFIEVVTARELRDIAYAYLIEDVQPKDTIESSSRRRGWSHYYEYYATD